MADKSQMLRVLQDRSSVPARMLTEPGPTMDEIREAVRAGVSAPDHGNLRPWHFILVEGATKDRLGNLFGDALKRRKPDATDEEVSNECKKAYRAPTIIILVIKTVFDNPKVPVAEQIVSGGAAAQNIMLAFDIMGYGSILLTGENSRDEELKSAIGLSKTDAIVGMIYVGTPPEKRPKKKRLNGADFEGHLHIWNGRCETQDPEQSSVEGLIPNGRI